MHQCIKYILFLNDTLHVSDGLSVHHQEFKTVHTAVKQTLLWKCVIPVVCVRKLQRVRSQTQLCQLGCLMTILDSYMFRPLLAIFRLSSRELKVLLYTLCAHVVRRSLHHMRTQYIYRVSLSLEVPNRCLCIQSNNAGFSFVNTDKQVHLKHARRHFERNLVKDVHHRSVASRNWLKS